MEMFSLLNMDFSDRVKERMKALKLTSIEVAQLVGVSKGSVTHWTNGTNQASGKRLIALASALECSAEWLATGESQAPSPASGPREEQPKPAKSAAAGMVLDMLKKHAGKSLNSAAQQRIAQAVADSLAEAPAPENSGNVIVADFSRSTVVRGDTISIAQYDVRGAMGAGQVPAEYREFVRNLVVDKVQLDDLGIKYTAPTNLKIITGWGQSMLGTIDDKSPLIVDIGVTDFVEEGVYVFTWLQHLFIKRVQLLDAEHFQLVSDNKVFEPQKARMEDMHFHAKVLGTWNFRRL
ncbi:S24 family peptidase [Pseudomonas sp. C9-3]|uniref:S24 family peptidase n=1 Tax=Pseudomonas sp. C9-3 TaxID=3078264 RepID=UPI0028F11D0D|nr:S24 family peptidase [Pseudomonas sp. C9-3]